MPRDALASGAKTAQFTPTRNDRRRIQENRNRRLRTGLLSHWRSSVGAVNRFFCG